MNYVYHVMILCGIYIILVTSLNLIMGYGGMFNVGQVAFYGIGAYAGALLSVHAHLPFLLELVLSALITTSFVIVIAMPAIRLKGDYLAFSTYALGVVAYTVFNNWLSVTRGPMGIPGVRRPSIFSISFATLPMYLLLVAVIVAITLFVFYRITNSPYGKSIEAIREDEIAAAAAGKNTSLIKVTVFCVGAFFTGIAGNLYVHYIGIADPTGFTTTESFLLMAMVILGGSASIKGSIAGAVTLVIIPELLRFVGIPSFYAQQLRSIIYGVVLVVIIIVRPQGIFGKLRF
jgi:branched-chain amino acid transport system permease protein